MQVVTCSLGDSFWDTNKGAGVAPEDGCVAPGPQQLPAAPSAAMKDAVADDLMSLMGRRRRGRAEEPDACARAPSERGLPGEKVLPSIERVIPIPKSTDGGNNRDGWGAHVKNPYVPAPEMSVDDAPDLLLRSVPNDFWPRVRFQSDSLRDCLACDISSSASDPIFGSYIYVVRIALPVSFAHNKWFSGWYRFLSFVCAFRSSIYFLCNRCGHTTNRMRARCQTPSRDGCVCTETNRCVFATKDSRRRNAHGEWWM